MCIRDRNQRAAKKMRPGHCTKKIHPGSPEVTFLGTDTSFAQSHPPLLEKYLIECNCSSYPFHPACYKDIMSLSNYTQRLALVLRKSISHQWGKVIRAKEKTTKEDLILALTAALVQQDQIQREVSRWFTYLTDGTSCCIDKKSAC